MRQYRARRRLTTRFNTLITLVSLFLVAVAPGARAQEAVATTAGRTVTVNGIEMYYEVQGVGEPLVLLHGFATSGRVWAPFLPAFTQKYQVIVPDLRGHGRSTNPSDRFTMRQSAADVLALLDRIGVRRFRAVGLSAGGMNLLHIATQQPDRVEAMVVVGVAPYLPEQGRAMIRRMTVESLTEADYQRMRPHAARGDDQIRALRRQFHGFKDVYDDMNLTPPLLATIRAKTLIVHGDHDPFFPVSLPVEMYGAIPGSELWIVPNGGHLPISDKNVPFAAAVLDFFLRKSAASPPK